MRHQRLAELPDLVSVGEAASYLRVSEATVYRMVNDGQLEAQRIRGVWRIHKSALWSPAARRVERSRNLS
jgi:excisionase family DNA binding protein